MSRYQTASFTTGSVAGGGGVLDYELALLASEIDISRIKITPSVASGGQIVEIFLKAARAASDLLYSTDEWVATYFSDPADEAGNEVLQGWVVPYSDGDNTSKLHLRITNNHSSAKTYDIEIDYEYQSTVGAGIEGVPESLYATAIANGLKITSGVVVGKNNYTNTEAEFRAARLSSGVVDAPQDLRTVAEGGSWVPDGINNLQVTGITATPNGAQYIFTSASAGRWYYTWRVKNSIGWSRWTDGNLYPQAVVQFVDTQLSGIADAGPPADWAVWVEPGPSTGTIVVHASRPRTNGNNLLWWSIQIKDADIGTWLALDNGTAPSDVKYDGSAVSHTLSVDRTTLTKATPGWGTAAVGDLVLLDVRGSLYDVNYCQWAQISAITSTSITISGFFRPQTSSDLRLKIVEPPQGWIGSGYLGDQDNAGIWPSGEEASANMGLGIGWIYGDSATSEFISTPINVPTTITNPEARVWFENVYARSDNSLTHSTGMSVGTGTFTAPRTFTDFNNRDYWLPVYPHSNWGTLVFASDGTVAIACNSPDSAYRQGGSGVRSRFRLYPDSAGIIQVQATFTGVTIPVGINSGDIFGLVLATFTMMNLSNTGHITGVSLYDKGTTSTQVALDEASLLMKYYSSASYDPTGGNMPRVRTPNYTRPASGSIVDLRFTIQERDRLGYRKVLAINTVEARTGGSGGFTSAYPSYGAYGPILLTGGLSLYAGLLGNVRLAGATATLTQITILSGIAEFC